MKDGLQPDRLSVTLHWGLDLTGCGGPDKPLCSWGHFIKTKNKQVHFLLFSAQCYIALVLSNIYFRKMNVIH